MCWYVAKERGGGGCEPGYIRLTQTLVKKSLCIQYIPVLSVLETFPVPPASPVSKGIKRENESQRCWWRVRQSQLKETNRCLRAGEEFASIQFLPAWVSFLVP